jgi:hypothetical protein
VSGVRGDVGEFLDRWNKGDPPDGDDAGTEDLVTSEPSWTSVSTLYTSRLLIFAEGEREAVAGGVGGATNVVNVGLGVDAL